MRTACAKSAEHIKAKKSLANKTFESFKKAERPWLSAFLCLFFQKTIQKFTSQQEKKSFGKRFFLLKTSWYIIKKKFYKPWKAAERKKQMNIHIIGGGAIGLFFAAEWSKEHSVTLQTKTHSQKVLLESNGICVREKNSEAVYFVDLADKAPEKTDLIAVAVKQYHLAFVLPEIPLAPSILFMQNGLSHLEKIKTLPYTNVYAASVEHGIVKKDNRTIQVNGRNQTKLASVKGGTKVMADKLQGQNFLFHWMEDAYYMLVDKLAANAVINPLTALLNVKNGTLAENSFYRSLLETLCFEFSLVFPYKTKKEITSSVLGICLKTAGNESSMLKDIKTGRQTEIDAIVGALLKEAEKKNVSIPAFQLLYELVKGKEAEYKEK